MDEAAEVNEIHEINMLRSVTEAGGLISEIDCEGAEIVLRDGLKAKVIRCSWERLLYAHHEGMMESFLENPDKELSGDPVTVTDWVYYEEDYACVWIRKDVAAQAEMHNLVDINEDVINSDTCPGPQYVAVWVGSRDAERGERPHPREQAKDLRDHYLDAFEEEGIEV